MANRNAYLRVALDAVALDRMAALAKFLADSAEVGGAQGFRAMARDTIHMTFFFAGEHLAQLSSEDLTRFYTAVSTAVSQFPICVDASTTRLRLQRALGRAVSTRKKQLGRGTVCSFARAARAPSPGRGYCSGDGRR